MTELEKPAFEVEAMGTGIGVGCNNAHNKLWLGVDVRGVEVHAAIDFPDIFAGIIQADEDSGNARKSLSKRGPFPPFSVQDILRNWSR